MSATYHLGDLVGVGPWPDETVALVAERGIAGVAGNYDSTVATDYRHCGCRYEDQGQEALAHQSYDWTRRQVSPLAKAALGKLPFRIDLMPGGGHRPGPRIVLVHGAPTLNTLYWSADRTDDFCLQMAGHAGLKPGDLIAFRHTHVPWYREVEGIHFVNAGSVGRPKDGDWRAGYVLVDARGPRPDVRFIGVAYDLERAVRAIQESELPPELAEFLRTGGRQASQVSPAEDHAPQAQSEAS